MELSAEERRVLGCLIEKQATTPDQYPLSTNALVLACNQKSNRDPVVEYDERIVMDATLLLRRGGLARMNSSGRTDKHRHILDDALGVDHDRLALLAIMLLRGPQSTGELKTRTERYPTSQGLGFESLDDIEAVLERMAEGTDPLVANVGRSAGQSQDRWAHLLGEPNAVADVGDADSDLAFALEPDVDSYTPGTDLVSGSADHDASLAERVSRLEERLAALEAALGMPEPDLGSDG
ncbi:MAG: YceH family protein [Ilumatobacter sp.]|uniref:YceH family protein n=1 Tax=Ilumatobacter sp. TaxID=1967498 RepID=UPI003297CB4A